jgi:hypothetical protein
MKELKQKLLSFSEAVDGLGELSRYIVEIATS